MVVNDTNTIASRLFAAIEEGDLDAVRDLYSPDVQIWHNVTNRSQTRDENLKLLAYFTSAAS
jgi:ketosteroid isomerase-like protein